MWFLSARKTRRTPGPRSHHGTFRPCLEALEDRCLLSAGALDPTFGTAGEVTNPTFSNGASAVVVQADGKIVVGSEMIGTNGSPSFALARYDPDGSPDTTFGVGGSVQTVVGKGASYIFGLALQSDGKIVAVGPAVATQLPVNLKGKRVLLDDTGFAIARYNTNGTLDPTFGVGGIVLTNVTTKTGKVDGDDVARAVAIDANGKIDVAGSTAPGTTSSSADFAIVRYLPSGALDTSFGPGKNGIVITPNFGNTPDGIQALTIQPSDGKIVVAGGPEMAVARYTTTGLLDSNFGTKGIWMGMPGGSTSAGAFGVFVQGNLGIIVTGASYSSSSHLTLARLTSTTGRLDTTFGSSGFAICSTSNGDYSGSAQGANGDILAAGGQYDVNGNAEFSVTAVLPSNGALDTTFGTGGTATAAFPGGAAWADAIAIQGDGKIVAAGTTSSSAGTMALARFLPPNTKIGSFTASPNPVTAGNSVSLTALGILNSNPTSTIT
jgi:uncharacterized delta-60 repeat protein